MGNLFASSQTQSAFLTIAVMFAMFVRETYPTEVVALIGVSTLIVTGVLPYPDAVAALSNPAPWTIAAMVSIAGALVRTGALQAITQLAERQAKVSPARYRWWSDFRGIGQRDHEQHAAGCRDSPPSPSGLATALGVDPRPLVVAVMVAASASFATPIGYQTNTLVYGPGGNRFADFLKFGIPLNLSLAPEVSFVIPFVWPL